MSSKQVVNREYPKYDSSSEAMLACAGRNFLRCVEGRENSNLNIVVINDSGARLLRSTILPIFAWFFYYVTVQCLASTSNSDANNVEKVWRVLSHACLLRAGGVKQASHLLKYDSTLGTFNADIKCAPPHLCPILLSLAVQ